MTVKIVYEASELAWPVGHVPQITKVEDKTFIFDHAMYGPDNEIAGWEFYSANDDQLIVLND